MAARESPTPRPLVIAAMAAALVAYGIIALFVGRRWISGLAALLVALLLWRQHPRARFAAYVFLSVVGVRAAVTGSWPALLFAAAAIAALQTPAARRAWPRLRRRWPRPRAGDDPGPVGDDRMTRP